MPVPPAGSSSGFAACSTVPPAATASASMRASAAGIARAQGDVADRRRRGAAVQREQMVIGAGAAQVERVAVTRGDVEMPDVAVERLGLGEIGNVEGDAAQGRDRRRAHRATSAPRPRKTSALRWTSCAVTAASKPAASTLLDRRALVEVERIVAAEHQAVGAEGRDQHAAASPGRTPACRSTCGAPARPARPAIASASAGNTVQPCCSRGRSAASVPPPWLKAMRRRGRRSIRLPVIADAAARPTSVG